MQKLTGCMIYSVYTVYTTYYRSKVWSQQDFFLIFLKETHKVEYMKSSDAKASKCHLKFSSRVIIFIKLVYLSSVISLKWQ